MKKLNIVRNDQELMTLRKIGASQAFANFTWSTTPFLVSCSTFTVFVLTQKEPLTTDIVFPALTLFNLLTFPLTILPLVISAIIEASVAVGRLTDFFTAEELQPDAVLAKPTAEKRGEESVRVSDATFTWDRHESLNVLENVNFSARKGELSCVVGRVGAGKSSLLQAVLGDLWKIKGQVVLHGTVAYVAQSPWVMNASVKENIVFGHRWVGLLLLLPYFLSSQYIPGHRGGIRKFQWRLCYHNGDEYQNTCVRPELSDFTQQLLIADCAVVKKSCSLS